MVNNSTNITKTTTHLWSSLSENKVNCDHNIWSWLINQIFCFMQYFVLHFIHDTYITILEFYESSNENCCSVHGRRVGILLIGLTPPRFVPRQDRQLWKDIMNRSFVHFGLDSTNISFYTFYGSYIPSRRVIGK
jgi:hypothetical protein